MYINGYFVSVVNILIFVAGFDYYQKLFLSPRPDGERRSSSSRILRSLGFTILLLVALIFCGGPLFSGLAALPLSQGRVWLHSCASYPTEMIFYGEANSSLPSTISFFVATGQPYPQ